MTQSIELRAVDDALTKVGFYTTLIFLTTLAFSIHWLGDNALTSNWQFVVLPSLWGFIVLLGVWELLRAQAITAPAIRSLVLVALVPAFRLAVSPGRPGWIWLPRLEWRKHNSELVHSMERIFATPMIIIAAFMLPIIAIELIWKSETIDPVIQMTMNASTGVIWMAFTIEFIIMITISEKKLKYCTTHWLDLVIILLPLLSYLRTARLIKLGKIAKTIRAYRMRSLMTKVFRGAATADLIGRLLRRSPEKRLVHLQEQIQYHKEEIAELERNIAILEKEQAE